MKPINFLFAILFIGGIAAIGYYIPRVDFGVLISVYSLLFVIYVYFSQQLDLKIGLFLAIGARLGLIFAFPRLSDDIYRFIFDGQILNMGLNPFSLTPTQLLAQYPENSNLNALFPLLNSPNYHTIYPPICQAIFGISAYLSPKSIIASGLMIKSTIILAEIGTLFLLYLQKNKQILWYALNPLIILELSGNAHFEGLMVFFLALFFFLFQKNKMILAAIAFAFSVAVKLLPLLFLPFLLFLYGKDKTKKEILTFFAVLTITLFLLFLPFFSLDFIKGLSSSTSLYFQKFEFNASLYYLLRWLGYQFSGYNLIQVIGPVLGITVFGLIFQKARKIQKSDNLAFFCLFAITIYLLCATTIHPWYATLPLFLSIFAPNAKWAVAWTYFIFFTYINYSYSPYHENLYIVGMEYSLTAIFFFFFKQ